jgi:hypothetical protein
MYKICSADDWSMLRDRPIVEVKIASNGFMLADRQKIAKETGEEFLQRVRDIEDTLDRKGMKFSHVISCGATEVTGFNRNADGWKAASLITDMPTYVKHARAFRDHRNSRQDEYFGLPKLAMYDRDRGYGRVLVGYFAKESALPDELAKIAKHEIDCLDRGECFRVSHGTKLAFDVCVICGNKAAKRAEYCDSVSNGGSCPLFGCVGGLAKIAEDGRAQFVDNPGNTFYDISSIGLTPRSARQADRIAYASPIDEIFSKAASEDGSVRGSAWLAENIGFASRPDLQVIDGLDDYQRRMLKAAVCLATEAENAKQSRELLDDKPGDLRSLFHSNNGVRQLAAKKLAEHACLPSATAFAKAGGADSDTAELVKQYADDLLVSAYRGEKLATLINASGFTRQQTMPSAFAAMDVQVSSINSLTDKRAAFLHAAFNAMRPMEKLASEKRFSDGDKELASKLAIDYTAMKILIASHFLEKPAPSSSFFIQATATAS